ncbi:protein of unknown function [Modestobacter italicus]|uniref:Uncharacterized protein n=1 Tax=Modestobacter italicus (strain DSM 44449 / CECT 9708 / BC 501) TaxID=2732864 RepID=I4F205_MODI5|nr:protein of unknown function [Modestobacter marinus]
MSSADGTVAPAAPPVRYPVPLAAATLTGGRAAGSLTVSVDRVRTGIGPSIPQLADDCGLDTTAVQTVPVVLTFETSSPLAGGLAAHLTVTPGPGTPAGTGPIGVFFEPATADETYCPDAPLLPTTDSFHARGTPRVTGYVVLDRAVTAATPQGRDDVLRTLQARISDLRLRTDADVEQPLSVGAVTQGEVCPDDPDALCVPLG